MSSRLMLKRLKLQSLKFEQFIQNDCKSQYLDLSENLQGISIEIFAKSEIETLRYGSNNIGDKGAEKFAQVLKSNNYLKELDLSNNKNGAKGAMALSEALITNTSLQKLVLWHNQFGIEGGTALANALTQNSSLKSLDIGAVGSKGVLAFLNKLKHTFLRKLDIVQVFYAREGGARALAEVLQTNSHLVSINFKRNEIGNEGAIILAKALETNSTLKELDLSSNRIGDVGAQALIEALKTNYSLRRLNLHSNNISIEKMKEFAEAFKTRNVTLIELSLNCAQEPTEISKYLERNREIQKESERMQAVLINYRRSFQVWRDRFRAFINTYGNVF